MTTGESGGHDFLLQQVHSRFFTDCHCIFIPQAGLDFADVSTAEDEHAQSGLADAAADCERKLPGKEFLVEIK